MNALKVWTVDDIRQAMTVNGSHWWDKSAMKFFGTRVLPTVYQGTGGVYFVTSEQPPHGSRAFSVRQYKPESYQIDTCGGLATMTRAQAIRTAKKLAGDAIVETVEPLSGQDIAKPKHMDLIKRMLDKCHQSGDSWQTQHARHFGVGNTLASLILALARYADEHEKRFESGIGDDGFLGKYWESMIRSTLALLNGELSGLDGGLCDGLLRSMLENEGFDAN